MIDVLIETGSRRVFARALDWPGWARSARDADGALEALLSYAPRYAEVAGRSFQPPKTIKELRVAERAKGDATTDFGAPSIAAKADRTSLDETELKRLVGLLQAAWKAFDAAAKRAEGVTLATGPRGGGRGVEKIRAHVLEADDGYLRAAGGKAPKPASAPTTRKAFVELLQARARGEEPELSPRRKTPLWSPRFTIARSAWHALDHAWEIEDRSP